MTLMDALRLVIFTPPETIERDIRRAISSSSSSSPGGGGELARATVAPWLVDAIITSRDDHMFNAIWWTAMSAAASTASTAGSKVSTAGAGATGEVGLAAATAGATAAGAIATVGESAARATSHESDPKGSATIVVPPPAFVRLATTLVARCGDNVRVGGRRGGDVEEGGCTLYAYTEEADHEGVCGGVHSAGEAMVVAVVGAAHLDGIVARWGAKLNDKESGYDGSSSTSCE